MKRKVLSNNKIDISVFTFHRQRWRAHEMLDGGPELCGVQRRDV